MPSNSIESLLEFIDNEFRVSHRVIAKETNNLERSITKLITDNLSDFELFGTVRFQIAPRKDGNYGGDQPKTFYLNEPQATLLLTFMRNNEIIKNFKIRLVKEFYRMREEIKNSKPEIAHQLVPNNDFDFDTSLKSLKEYKAYANEMLDFLESLQKRDRIGLYRLNKIIKLKNINFLEYFGINFENEYFIPTELGAMINRSPVEINKILEAKGFQIRENRVWSLTEKGKSFGIEITKGLFLQIKWKIEVILN